MSPISMANSCVSTKIVSITLSSCADHATILKVTPNWQLDASTPTAPTTHKVNASSATKKITTKRSVQTESKNDIEISISVNIFQVYLFNIT